MTRLENERFVVEDAELEAEMLVALAPTEILIREEFELTDPGRAMHCWRSHDPNESSWRFIETSSLRWRAVREVWYRRVEPQRLPHHETCDVCNKKNPGGRQLGSADGSRHKWVCGSCLEEGWRRAAVEQDARQLVEHRVESCRLELLKVCDAVDEGQTLEQCVEMAELECTTEWEQRVAAEKRISELEAELAQAVADRDEARTGYHALDKNWAKMHEASMGAIRSALALPDGSIPELNVRIERLTASHTLLLDLASFVRKRLLDEITSDSSPQKFQLHSWLDRLSDIQLQNIKSNPQDAVNG
jgi:hypothetical protein